MDFSFTDEQELLVESIEEFCERYAGEDEIKEYLAGNLCRCSGYEGQLRGILNFLAWKKGKEAAQ